MTEPYDISGKIGDLFPNQQKPEWPMYSYSRPANMLWNGIASVLHEAGWSDAKIKEWLASKATRWALDGTLGDMIIDLGQAYAREHILSNQITVASRKAEAAYIRAMQRDPKLD